MSQNFRFSTYENRTIGLSMLMLFGLISSNALISVASALLFLNLILSYKQNNFKIFTKSNSEILSYLFYFSPFLLLFPFSGHFNNSLHRLWQEIPWIIIPLAWAAMPSLSKAKKDVLLLFFVLIILVSGSIVLINFLGNYSYYVDEISRGKHIPMPLGHVRFSLMVVFAGLMSIWQFINNGSKVSPYDRRFYGIASVFFFVLIHLINVRIAWGVYYVSLIYLAFYFAFKYKKMWLPVLVSVVLAFLPFVAYKTIPSFHNKIDYMRYDWQQMNEKEVGFYSDTRRFLSNKMAVDLIKEKPVFGHGIGRVHSSCMNYYQTNLPQVKPENQKLPHMQYLYTFVESGAFGFVFIMVALLYPLIKSLWFKNPMFVVLSLIILLSCLVDQTLESQVGEAFYLLMGAILLKKEDA